MKYSCLWLALLGWLAYATTLEKIAVAQSIVPTGNTGTIVTPANSQQVLIRGGTQAGNNLFHQFQQFGLAQGQTATFQANPTVGNIFGRVSGGTPSLINGTLQVTGAPANLFLINPAGMIVGRDARLDLPGSLSITTADALEFDRQTWLRSRGENSYADLSGNVTGYAWVSQHPGAVINAGNLAVQPGKTLTLSGGSVINTGTIAAPGGQVTIAAVPGENVVRVSQENQVLSLDLPLSSELVSDAELDALPPPPTTQRLPQLLAGRDIAEATGITIDNGQVRLSTGQAAIALQNNQAIVAGEVTAPKIDITGERIDLQEASLNASTANSGGQIRVGGDFQGTGDLPRAQQVNIDANSQLNADALQNGNGGRVIVWADERTRFAGEATAKGGAQGGNGGLVETSGQQQLIIESTAKVSTSAAQGATGEWLLDPTDLSVIPAGGTAGIIGGTNSPTTASTIDRPTLEAALNGNNVNLQATNSITVDSPIDTTGNAAGGNLQLSAPTTSLNQRIQLRPGSTLSGNATTVNVGNNGSVQNAVDAVATDGIVNLAATTYREGQTITINRSITLQGQGAANTIISGDGNNDGTGDYRVLRANAGTLNFTLRQLTIADGQTVSAGAGLLNGATNLQIADAVFRDNLTTDPVAGDGGAIFNSGSGTIDITQTRFERNQAGDNGGALDVFYGSATIRDSVFTQNRAIGRGGTIDVEPGGTVNITNSTFTNNQAEDAGAIHSAGILTIDGSLFQNNQATNNGGAIVSSGDLSITNSSMLNNVVGQYGGGIFNTGNLALNRLTIRANQAIAGGGIFNQTGQIDVANSLLEDNRAIRGSTTGDGAAIYSYQGPLNVSNSDLRNNQAQDFGGAIVSTEGDLSITSTTFTGNTARLGGAVHQNLGTLSISESNFSTNQAQQYGGGLNLLGLNPSQIQRTTIQNNQSGDGGGGIALEGPIANLTLDRVALLNNRALRGGGIDATLARNYSGNLNIINSTIAANQVTTNGGGIDVNPTATGGTVNITNTNLNNNISGDDGGGIALGREAIFNITNSTLSQNQAANRGGAIAAFGIANLTNVTAANNQAANQGGGLFADIIGQIRLNNSLIATNQAANSADVVGNFVDQGRNLIGVVDGATGFAASPLVGSSANPIDPLLAPLANYGGSNQTIALLPGSPAIDAGNSPLPTDQRGIARVGVPDIGAFESQGFTIATQSGNTQTTEINTSLQRLCN